MDYARKTGSINRRASPQRFQKSLPSLYYLEHFQEMLDFVDEHYKAFLDTQEREFILDFKDLTQDQQCLYVRLVNRKGHAFVRANLRYAEITDLDGACAGLLAKGWIVKPEPADLPTVLASLTKERLLAASRDLGLCLPKAIRKADLLATLQSPSVSAKRLTEAVSDAVLLQWRTDPLYFLLYLYFGHTAEGLGQFTMRDLGLTRTQGLVDQFEPRFGDREEALEHYYFARRLAELRAQATDRLERLVVESENWPEPEFPGAARLRDKLAARLGRELERQARREEAISVYRRGESLLCTERRIRLLLECGAREAAGEELLSCIEQPRTDEERLFAEDLYARKFHKKRTAAVTDNLRSASVLKLDEALRGSPERAVKNYFEQRGYQVYRTENKLWRMLFGLVFWEELFGATAGIHSPFELLPKVLRDNDFGDEFAELIEQRFAQLSERAVLVQHVLRVATAHYGVDNGVFRWRRSTLDALLALVKNAPPAAVVSVLRHLCRSYRAARAGFPDLMRVRDGVVSFVEVKAEGDQLRRNQLLRLNWLNEAGLDAEVLCVEWIVDPEQSYVVVDVETTGGRGEQHRITEIAAVKVRGNERVDQFHSLLNPDRTIPAAITRLTGISNAMVTDAPRFAEIADELAAFMEGSIFVAHNVNFDYGFVSREFARLNRPFRAVKLCTVANMRKYYPGHRSYALAALCERYAINLNSHHRALCDAEAAMELLFMINAKRVMLKA